MDELPLSFLSLPMLLSFSLLSRNIRILITILGSYILLLGYLALTSNDTRFTEIFSETGFFEQCSIITWILAAMVACGRAWKRRSKAMLANFAHAMLFMLCAMREADWHKKFTAEGILKIKYYTRSAAALSEKIPAAFISLFFIALIVHALISGWNYVKTKAHLKQESTWIMIAGIGLFFVGKILDRSVSMLTGSFDLTLSPWLKKTIAAQEEGLEMLTPLLIALAFFWPNPYSNQDCENR